MKSIARWPVAVASVLALGAGCGSKSSPPSIVPTDGSAATTDAAPIVIDGGTIDGAACTTTIQQQAEEGYLHISCTDQATYLTNPPSSGNHYPCWAAYQSYDAPIPWGNLVHSLEHGAVIIVYNCPDGCPDDVANIQSFIAGLPLDTDCAPTLGKNRVISMPDPTLDVRFAATAWGWTLRSDCFDPAAFQQFYDAHYDHGREIICSDGWTGSDLCATCPYD